jgi:guanylate kinase
MSEPKLLVISGTSAGAGKDTLMKMFIKKHSGWKQPPSTTTRAPRSGEVDGVDYYFVSKESFEQQMQNGEFLEADFHAGNWYGTLKKPVEELLAAGENIVLRKDVNGSVEIKKKIPQAIVVFIDVESMEVLESRIRQRNLDSEQEILERLNLAKKEMELKKHFDHVIINPHNRPEQALSVIEKAAGF